MSYLFIAMDDDKIAHPMYLADDAAVLRAVKDTVFDYRDDLAWDPEHVEEAEGIAKTLLEDGYFPFEGDPPLYLFRVPDDSEWVARVVSSGPAADLPLLEWRSADVSLSTAIGAKLYTARGVAVDRHQTFSQKPPTT